MPRPASPQPPRLLQTSLLISPIPAGFRLTLRCSLITSFPPRGSIHPSCGLSATSCSDELQALTGLFIPRRAVASCGAPALHSRSLGSRAPTVCLVLVRLFHCTSVVASDGTTCLVACLLVLGRLFHYFRWCRRRHHCFAARSHVCLVACLLVLVRLFLCASVDAGDAPLFFRFFSRLSDRLLAWFLFGCSFGLPYLRPSYGHRDVPILVNDLLPHCRDSLLLYRTDNFHCKVLFLAKKIQQDLQ